MYSTERMQVRVYHIRALNHIRSSLSTDMAKTVASALVNSRLDYANSALYNTSSVNMLKLQRVHISLLLYYLTDCHQNLWKHWAFKLEHIDDVRNASFQNSILNFEKRLPSLYYLTVLYHALSWKASHDNERWLQTPSLIGLWTVASIPKIYIKYCDFVPRYYGKQLIVYHALCKHLCVRLIAANINVKCSCVMHIKQLKY